MKVLIVEDDAKIKVEAIDPWLDSLGFESDWAQSQEEANGLLVASEYDLILLDLKIPSRPGGQDVPEFGKNLLKQIRARKGRDVPVILITGEYQHCVDLMIELQEIGIDGSIAKPFPTVGRTLAVVIEDVLARHRRFRMANPGTDDQPLEPFDGAVLAYHPDHIDLGGVTICEKSQRGCAWQILQALGQKDGRGNYVHLQSTALARQIKPKPIQNTLFRAISTLRDRIEKAMKRCGKDCGREDVIGHDEGGYHLTEKIIVEAYGEDGTPVGHSDSNGRKASSSNDARPKLQLNEKQRWALAHVAENGTLTRREVEKQFGISDRTAKRLLGELTEAGLIEFDRNTHPGFYRLK